MKHAFADEPLRGSDCLFKEAATSSGAVGVAGEVKRAAQQAGRDPGSARVRSRLAAIGDHPPEDIRLKKTMGRTAAYPQGCPLHGAGPTQPRPVVEEYARTRPTGKFDHPPPNPGSGSV